MLQPIKKIDRMRKTFPVLNERKEKAKPRRIWTTKGNIYPISPNLIATQKVLYNKT